MSAENNNARLGILIHSVLEGQLGNLHCSHEISFTIDWNIRDGSQNITNLTALGDVQFNSVSRLRHDSKSVLGVLLHLDIANVSGSIVLAFPAGRCKISISVVL
jgi:hypothetical protein